MISGVSSILNDIVMEKMSGAEEYLYVLETTFYNAGDKEEDTDRVEISPVQIDAMTIEQDFENGGGIDKIGMRCSFAPKDLLTLLGNTQDLFVQIKEWTWTKRFYDINPLVEPGIYKYRVLIDNPQDVLKKIPPAALKKTAETDYDREQLMTPISVDMQLTDDIDYDKFKKGAGYLLADTDVQSAILHYCKLIGIEKTYIVPPTNKNKKANITIPSLTSMASFIDMLQTQVGIYDKGATQYYSGNTLYVYPPYDTNPDKSEVINIFKLPENSVDGGAEYCNVKDGEIYIVTFSKVVNQNTAESSTENTGNAVTVKQADTSMDIGRDIDNDGNITLNKQNSLIVKVNNSSTNKANQVNTTHGGTTANIFDPVSKIAAGQREIIGLGWVCATLFLIIPGMKAIIHYDDTAPDGTDFYNTTPGIVSYVKYDLQQQGKPDGRTIVYRWNAYLAISVPPKEQDTTQTQAPVPADNVSWKLKRALEYMEEDSYYP